MGSWDGAWLGSGQRGSRGHLPTLVGQLTNSGFMVRGESRMRPPLDYMNGPEAHCNNPGLIWWCCHTVDEGNTAFEGLGIQGALAGPPKILGGWGAVSTIPHTQNP